ATREVYQRALDAAGYGPITTEILPLKHYLTAEEYHQDYLKKNPDGYCGLGGTGVKYSALAQKAVQGSASPDAATDLTLPLKGEELNFSRQLVIFESENCEFCEQF